jgi:ParB-like chromosome segregation protein Spo0J
MELKIEYVPIDSIKPYSKNAKLHPAEQIEQIKKSIQEFGFKDAIAVWNNEVVAGHGRLLAAKELGMKELPIVRLDDLTDEQRRAYALVHNKLTMNSPFDDGILSEELDNILDIDMSMFDLGEVFDESTTKTQTFTGGEIDTDNFSDDKYLELSTT